MTDWKRDDPRIDVHLFSNATEFDFWFENNCARCRFYRASATPGFAHCPILDMIYDASGGSLPAPFARLFQNEDGDAHLDSATVCPGYQDAAQLPRQPVKPDTSHLVPTHQDEWLAQA